MLAQAFGEHLHLRILHPRLVLAQPLPDVGANQRLIAAIGRSFLNRSRIRSLAVFISSPFLRSGGSCRDDANRIALTQNVYDKQKRPILRQSDRRVPRLLAICRIFKSNEVIEEHFARGLKAYAVLCEIAGRFL